MRELQWVADGASIAMPGPVSQSRMLVWLAAATALALAVIAGAMIFRARAQPVDAPLVRSSILPPSSTRFERGSPPAVSPDGRQIAFAAVSGDGKRRLWVRSLDSVTAQQLPDTDSASYPFWSPDSQSVGFFAEGKLKRINVSGGPPTTLADAAVGRGGSWSPAGVIVFAPSIYSGLYRVSAAGGAASPATRFGPGTPAQKFPFFLPDGRHFLYLNGAGGRDQQSIRVGSLDSLDETRTILDNADGAAMYAQGYVLLVRGGTLLARPIDVARLTVTGDDTPVADSVLTRGVPLQSWVFSVSTTGVLVYQPNWTNAQRLTWLDRAGRAQATVGEQDDFGAIELSPDPRTAAVSINDPVSGSDNIWLYDLSRGLRSRFTTGLAPHGDPVWSPDGRIIVSASNRKGRFDL